MSSQEEPQKIDEKEVITEIAKFLSFFAESRIYRPIDSLAKPFTYEDVVNALEDALRQANVVLESSYEKEVGEGRKLRVVKVRGEKEIPAPYIPRQEIVRTFLELCKKDLTYSKEAALLSLTYRPKLEVKTQ